MRVARLLILVLVGVLVAATADALVLCARKKGGTLKAREQCKKREQQVDPAALGLQGPPGEPGPPGQPGAQGTPGPEGASLAYAYVRREGQIDPTRAKGITDDNLSHPKDGVYCFKDLPFVPKNIIATLEEGGDAIRVTLDAGSFVSCADTDDAGVLTFEILPGVDRAFYVLFN